MPKMWYCSIRGKVSGPLAGSVIKQMVATGAIGPEDLVRPEGQEEWFSAKSIEGFFDKGAQSVLQAKCPGCDAPLTYDSKYFGKRFKCAKCLQVVEINKEGIPQLVSPHAAIAPGPKAVPADFRPVKYKCHDCGAILESPLAMAGQKDACPSCHASVTVPQPRKRGLLVPLAVLGVGAALGLGVLLIWQTQSPTEAPGPSGKEKPILAIGGEAKIPTQSMPSVVAQGQSSSNTPATVKEPAVAEAQSTTELPKRPKKSNRSRLPERAPATALAEPTLTESRPAVPVRKKVPRLIDPPLDCSSPSWSPDGKEIMFVGRPPEQRQTRGESRPGNIWIASADGSKRRLVTNFFFGQSLAPQGQKANALKLDVKNATWSPDGQRIAFVACKNDRMDISNLYVMRCDGTDIFRVIGNIGRGVRPWWTPDGNGIIVGDVMTNVDGTEMYSFTYRKKLEVKPEDEIEAMIRSIRITSPDLELSNACPSRDGSRILAIGTGGKEVLHAMCISNKQGQQVRWYTREPKWAVDQVKYRYPCWSPDEKEFAVDSASDTDDDLGILVFDVATGKNRRLVEGLAPSWSPDGKTIVFEGGQGGGRGDVFVIGPDGNNLRRITNLTSTGVKMTWGSHPRWSPDGKMVVFRRGLYVWTMNRDGTGETCAAEFGLWYRASKASSDITFLDCLPCWRPDGKIVFTVKQQWMTRITHREEVLATATPDGNGILKFMTLQEPSRGAEICWSRDGSWMAYDMKENIWVAKGDGTKARRLAGGSRPRWSPDGTKILFFRGSKDSEVLCVMNNDGSNQTEITEPRKGGIGYHSWCPNGKTVAFQRGDAIHIVSPSGGDERALLERASQPCWSPDGNRMACIGNGTLTRERLTSYNVADDAERYVYIMNADSSQLRPLMQIGDTHYGRNSVTNLSWASDGKSILLEEDAGEYIDEHRIWIIDVLDNTFSAVLRDPYP